HRQQNQARQQGPPEPDELPAFIPLQAFIFADIYFLLQHSHSLFINHHFHPQLTQPSGHTDTAQPGLFFSAGN
ncbi:hypothetical protein DNM18_27320, partial [Salmonella enterica subsp. enterica]|nr:hypothetical protein [Salmonella enterica subsp. enterica serovar Poona]